MAINNLARENIVGALANKSSNPQEIETKTSNYTLAFSDKDKLISFNSASATTVTIPTNTAVPFAIGSKIDITNVGTGNLTIAGASGVTLSGIPTILAQNQSAQITKLGTNSWTVRGYASFNSPTFTGTVGLPLTTNYNGTQLDTRFNEKLNIANQQSNRNLLYNGAMQVHQRGTSTTGITGIGYYTADRWRITLDTLGTWTSTIENDAPTGSGFRKSLKVLCSTADASPSAGGLINIVQNLEGQDVQRIAKGTASARQITLSFWVKSNVTGTYIVEMRDVDNTRSVSGSYSVAASGTWEKKTITFPADTSGVFDNDNAVSLQIAFFLGAGSDHTSGTLNTSWASRTLANIAPGQTNLAAATNNYWQITGVQLEVGPNATEFEFKSFGQELAECQRYYFRTSTGSYGSGFNQGETITYGHFDFPQEMRAVPTAFETSTLGTRDATGVLFAGTNPIFERTTRLGTAIYYDIVGGNNNSPASLVTTGSGYVAASAEL
jgi:hypothetical protein